MNNRPGVSERYLWIGSFYTCCCAFVSESVTPVPTRSRFHFSLTCEANLMKTSVAAMNHLKQGGGGMKLDNEGSNSWGNILLRKQSLGEWVRVHSESSFDVPVAVQNSPSTSTVLRPWGVNRWTWECSSICPDHTNPGNNIEGNNGAHRFQ